MIEVKFYNHWGRGRWLIGEPLGTGSRVQDSSDIDIPIMKK